MDIDTLIKVLAYGLVPLTLTLLGNHLAAQSEQRKYRRRYQAAFFGLFAAGVTLSGAVEMQSERTHIRELAEARIEYQVLKQNSDRIISSLQSENANLLGRLDTISSVLGGMRAGHESDDAILRGLVKAANEPTATDRSAANQKLLGTLLAEGRELNSSCFAYGQIPATPALVRPLEDWERRAYVAAATSVDPKLLQLLDSHNSTKLNYPHSITADCGRFSMYLWAFRNVMVEEFSSANAPGKTK